MDAYLARIKSGWLIFWLWITMFLLAAVQKETSYALAEVLGVIVVFVCCLGYPLVLVFASSATNASVRLQILVAISLAAFCAAVILAEFEVDTVYQLHSAMGTIALLCVQFGAARALAEAERRFGVAGGVLSAWSALFFFPFLGFLVHRRHAALVQRASAV
jgi:hypothetical protein